ncbi:hypothetical protein HPB50_029114 [Hyalomma asiaticum]|nr:hypothetical protein HPB50_029114 [Hyalomma asiaticum]
MINGRLFFVAVLLNAATRSFTFNPASYDRGLEGLTDGFLKQVMSRIQAPAWTCRTARSSSPPTSVPSMMSQHFQRTCTSGDPSFGARHLGRYRKEGGGQRLKWTSSEDPAFETMSGAGEGFQRLKPDGIAKNVQVVKTDAVLPAYCNPPNPCPKGYTVSGYGHLKRDMGLFSAVAVVVGNCVGEHVT